MRRIALMATPPVLLAGPGMAHVSEQGLVLLLPTGHYITGGVLAVAASIVLVALVPAPLVRGVFAGRNLTGWKAAEQVRLVTSTLASLCLAGIVIVGITGPRDPLTNLLPLTIWVGLWITLFGVVGLAGNLWRWIEPWSGPGAVFGSAPPLRLPDGLGHWPALAQFAAFSAFYITDPAPQDPDRLAQVVALYWAVNMVAVLIFGPEWLRRGEALSVLFHLMAQVSPWASGRIGTPGHALMPERRWTVSLAVFALTILAMGSFDGLKETFWWLARIGVNPLEFPGRSAVQGASLVGLALSVLALLCVFGGAVWAGGRLAGGPHLPLAALFCHFAPSVLPIALGYHISHFLISFMVDGQYLLAVLGDPLARGWNLFGLADIRVTTGFLNTPASVKAIWLSQAGIVVMGHILSVLVAHAIALRLFETPRRAALSQLPIGAFMVLYTFFGLWLLAAPRGV